MAELDGMRVATLEARMTGALASMISKRGGKPVCAPALREAPLDCADDVRYLLDKLAGNSIDVVVFQTGVGARALFAEADRQSRLDELLDALRGITTVCRGPKPTAALRQAKVQVSAGIAAPYTTKELLDALIDLPVRGKRLMALQYGERNAALMSALRDECETADELCLYEWQLPDDTTPMASLIDELLDGTMDVIAFTSQVQIRHLYQVAAANDVPQSELSNALNERTIVCAVGPTCAAALADVGVATDTQPEYPKMGHMVNALAEYVSERSAANAVTPL
ncbi:MAG: uroporphyrinogen-III synthase [Chloroflexota bacterium]|nr:uroporphyrinogen-III synthase [Chloroflexota bacterium]